MFKSSIVQSGHEPLFIRKALSSGMRLDGRLFNEFRDVELNLYRGESNSSAEVQIGNTRVFCNVHGQIAIPYPDRPTEGILQFGAQLSQGAESVGLSHIEIVRLLERCIRESEAIDTESLCIVGGEKVWLISCEIRVIDFSGNVLDAAIMAAMGALRAFRKPEISIVGKSSSSSGQLIIHSSDEREPLPLALHHTPLAVSIGVFKSIPSPLASDKSSSSSSSTVLIGDPDATEERAMDGALTISINTHHELCAVHKPGGVGIHAETILEATKMAAIRAETLHQVLQAALVILDANVDKDRNARLELLQSARAAVLANAMQSSMDVETAIDADASALEDGGIHRDDPVLSWALLHRPAISE